jgi:hypothetical protein
MGSWAGSGAGTSTGFQQGGAVVPGTAQFGHEFFELVHLRHRQAQQGQAARSKGIVLDHVALEPIAVIVTGIVQLDAIMGIPSS